MTKGTKLMLFSGSMALLTVFMALMLKNSFGALATIPGVVCFVSGCFGVAMVVEE
jgi:hypothetical protein